MINIQVLSLLLLLVCPLYIKGDDEKCKDEESEATDIGGLLLSMQNISYDVSNTLAKLDACKKQEKSNEELKTIVSDLTNVVKSQSEIIKEQGEKIQDQDQNIRDLRKSLDKRLRENDLKIEWALTDGTLAPQNTSGIMENLARQEKMLKEVLDYNKRMMNHIKEVEMEVKMGAYKPSSCAEIEGGGANGVHRIYPNHTKPILVNCNMSAGGGWTVIQRRFDGSVDFFRGWEEYAEGFGDPAGEYWVGLRHIHAMTKTRPMELYIGVKDFDLGFKYAKYATFSVSAEDDKFRLNVGTYSGNAGDSLWYHNGKRFSTKDQDNDIHSKNCGNTAHGAWWYQYCAHSNLNGLYSAVKVAGAKYMYWYYLQNNHNAMKASIMMIRPANFRPQALM